MIQVIDKGGGSLENAFNDRDRRSLFAVRLLALPFCK